MHIVSLVLPRNANTNDDDVFVVSMKEYNRVTVKHKEQGTVHSTHTYTVAEYRDWLETLCYMLTVDHEPYLNVQWMVSGLPTITLTIEDLHDGDRWAPVERALEFSLLRAVKTFAPSFQCGAAPGVGECPCPPAWCCDGTVPDHEAHPKEYADAMSESSSESESDIYADMPPLIDLTGDSESDSESSADSEVSETVKQLRDLLQVKSRGWGGEDMERVNRHIHRAHKALLGHKYD